MFEFLRRLRRPAPSIDDELWRITVAALPWAHALDAPRQQRLRELSTRFLHEKTITPVQGLHLDEVQHGMLAAMCCLPLLEFGAEGLHGWSQMLVYPDEFRVKLVDFDENDVQHEWHEEISGESHDNGVLIVSWADVVAECAAPHRGDMVVVHEMAHKLDFLDGLVDGTPPLPREWQLEWARDLQAAYEDFGDEVDALLDAVDDDPDLVLSDEEEAGYLHGIRTTAADAPEEFFAVVSECHFSNPSALLARMPQVAAHLTRFYGPSPFA